MGVRHGADADEATRIIVGKERAPLEPKDCDTRAFKWSSVADDSTRY